MNNIKKVDFFIVGAPKSGTTALAHYLSQHPNVCFSNPKEPHFFADDFEKFKSVKNLYEYHDLFIDTGKLWGEGSVWYYYSDTAIENIMNYNPQAKIIFMMRNPLEMVVSMHNQALFTLDETIENFEEAWRKIPERKQGKSIPFSCRNKKILFYDEIGKYDFYLKKIYQYVNKDKVKVILFDEFKKNNLGIYKEILNFLELPYDGKKNFEKVNEAHMYKNKYLKYLIKYGSYFGKEVKKRLGIKRNFKVFETLNEINKKRIDKKKDLSDEMKQLLWENYKGTIENLEIMLNKDLSFWKIKG